MNMRCAFLFMAGLFSGALLSAEGLVVALGPSAYADTEVSTNVPFNVRRSDLKGQDVDFSFHATASNSLQVAVGRDDDGDGVLSMSETGVLFGWRGGAFVVENVPDQARRAGSGTWRRPATWRMGPECDVGRTWRPHRLLEVKSYVASPFGRTDPYCNL